MQIEAWWGVDRIFTHPDGRRWSVEYKTEIREKTTRNVFVEVESSDKSGKPGWAVWSLAQLLVVYFPHRRQGYIARMDAIKRALPEWHDLYPLRAAINEGWTTTGLCVPTSEFRKCCSRVILVLGLHS